MLERGYNYDPNRLASADSLWWEELGTTLGPAPYETAAWCYYQAFDQTLIAVPDNTPDIILDGGVGIDDGTFGVVGLLTQASIELDAENGSQLFTDGDCAWTNPTVSVIVDDGVVGTWQQTVFPTVQYDGGKFNSEGERFRVERLTFASVYVYDCKASYPTNGTSLQNVTLHQQNLLTDMPTLPLLADENAPGVFELAADTPDGVPAIFYDDQPPGTQLGRLNFELLCNTVTVTDWDHYGWNDSTPVVKAFEAMVNGLPQCADPRFGGKIVVRDDPTAFLVANGFVHEYKGSSMLVYDPANKYETY